MAAARSGSTAGREASRQKGGVRAAVEHEEIFRVEYLYYLLVILALVALCLYLVRIPGQMRLTRKPVDLADRARVRRRRQQEAAEQAPAPSLPVHVLRRELKQVPTPWGWPGSEARHSSVGANGSPGSLHDWIDRLVSEKCTVDDDAYRLRTDASMRALLEDRFGRPAQASEMAYRQVKPPQLRDSSRPYDQMDNFPSGRTERIMAGLNRPPAKPLRAQRDLAAHRAVELKNMKTPWGW